MVLAKEDEGEEVETENGDVLLVKLSLALEVALSGSNPDEIVAAARNMI